MIQQLQRIGTRSRATTAGRHAAAAAATAERQSTRRVWTFSFAVFIAATALYGTFLTVTHSGDDLQYAALIQHHLTGDIIYYPTGSQPYLSHVEALADPLPLNPRYLLEWPTSILAAKVAYALNWPGNVIMPIQVLRILVGPFGLAMFFVAIVRIVKSIPIGLLVTAGLGLTVSYWTYSTHTDQSINMVALLCLAFLVFANQTETGFTRRGVLSLIGVLTLATLYNLTAVISVIAFSVGVALFSQRTGVRSRLCTFVGFGTAYTAVVAMVITAAMAIFGKPADLVDPDFWREASFAGRPDYLVDPIHDAVRAAFGLGRSDVLLPGVYGSLNDYFDHADAITRLVTMSYYAIILLILASPFILLALRHRKIGRNGKLFVVLLIWFSAHAAFNWFWDPGYNKYWLMPLVCCWAVFALALDHLRVIPSRYYRPAFLGLCVFVCASFVINLSSQFWPDSRPEDNKWLTTATRMGGASQPADLFLSPGHPVDFYLSFFGRRDILSADLVSLSYGDEESRVESAFSSRIAAHRADDGEVYVYGLEALDDTQRSAFMTMLGNGTLTEKWALPGTTVYRWNSTACQKNMKTCP